MTDQQHRLLRSSLVFVWLATALVSAWELQGQSRELLKGVAFLGERGITALILGGVVADAVIGLWLAFRPGRAAYIAALGLMGGMTLLATVVEPTWWLHPFGPLTKNIPIAAILAVLLLEKP